MRSRLLALLIAPALALGVAACDVDQTEEGSLPDIDIEGGNLPEYDVDFPEVEITRDTVTVPSVDIRTDDDTTAVDY